MTPQGQKAVPLLLRKRRDGSLWLDSDEFPPDHEFSVKWLLEHTADATVVMSDTEIILTLANGTATYRIDRDRMEQRVEVEDEATGEVTVTNRKLSTGYWGVLVDSEVHRG